MDRMKKIVLIVVALVSCVLLFNSCEKDKSADPSNYALDGYTYHNEDFWPEETWSFQDGKVTRYIYFGKDAYIESETLKYDYLTKGSKLYVGIGLRRYKTQEELEEATLIKGIVSGDKSYINLTSEYGTYMIYSSK